MHPLTQAAAAAFAASLAVPAFAQSRVIEETLILKDPTVAPLGGAVFGASAEALYVNAPFKSFSTSDDGTLEEGRAKATSVGGNVFAGYGDLTAQFTYRNARGKSTLTHDPSSTVPERYRHSVEAVPRQQEALLRWLGRGLATSWFTPYLYLGYTKLSSDFDDVRETGTWALSGTNRLRSVVDVKAFIGGLGLIVPMSERFGFRGDIGVTRSKQTTNRQGHNTAEDTGIGSRWTGTMYYNFAEHWNAQLGGRYEYFNGERAGSMTIAGVFAMVGFTFK
jgi:hypothetical protein